MQLTQVRRYSILGLDLDTFVLSSLYILSFVIPLVIGHPQLLVGSSINFLIVFSSLKYGFKKSIPILLIPSLVATGNGLLFGSATLFLVYLMPFIMISNTILSFTISKQRNILGILLGSILKVISLYSITLLLTKVIGLPTVFLTSMGSLQLYTALIGGGVAFLIFLLTREK